jgi:[ribosomal protein S18]-alanine N-acetyltransferase
MNASLLPGFRIRWMIRRDLPEVLDIENRNSGRSHNIKGIWAEEDFLAFLRQPNAIGMVATHTTGSSEEHVCGFMLYQLFPDRIHIFNLVVDPALLREGVGTALIDRLKAKLSVYRRTMLEIDIREVNLGACFWLKHLGFKAVQVIREWYQAPLVEDAYKFRFTLENSVNNGDDGSKMDLPESAKFPKPPSSEGENHGSNLD